MFTHTNKQHTLKKQNNLLFHIYIIKHKTDTSTHKHKHTHTHNQKHTNTHKYTNMSIPNQCMKIQRHINSLRYTHKYKNMHLDTFSKTKHKKINK